MTVEDLMQMVSRRLVHLSQVRNAADALGDVARVAELDAEIAQTEQTLAQLRSL
jgi:hypothetical protein